MDQHGCFRRKHEPPAYRCHLAQAHTFSCWRLGHPGSRDGARKRVAPGRPSTTSARPACVERCVECACACLCCVCARARACVLRRGANFLPPLIPIPSLHTGPYLQYNETPSTYEYPATRYPTPSNRAPPLGGTITTPFKTPQTRISLPLPMESPEVMQVQNLKGGEATKCWGW
jgi:hypothetical protein